MNNWIAVLQAGLENVLGSSHSRIDFLDLPQNFGRFPRRESSKEEAALELQKDPNLPRLYRSNRIRKRGSFRN